MIRAHFARLDQSIMRASLACFQGHRNERGAAEDHVDAHEKAERPYECTRKAKDDNSGKDQIDDAVHHHPFPFLRQLAAMGDGEDNDQNAIDNKKGCQHIG